MLAQNIIRINGYKGNKRTHIDIEVEMHKNCLGNIIPRIPHFSDVPRLGFENGLEAVTSFNYYNWVGKERYTEKC